MIYNSTRERCALLAEYLIENRCTIRQAASYFSISKSTVHKDISIRLRHIDKTLYEQAKVILETNKSERHLRGGEATKRKYSHQKKNVSLARQCSDDNT